MAKLNVLIPAVSVTIEGVEYRKVDRKAAEGDVIRMTSGPSFITDGGFYEVTRVDGAGDPQINDDDGDSYDTVGDTFEVYEAVTKKKRLTVGDYAKVIGNHGDHRYEMGDVILIVHDDEDACPYRGEHANGERGNFLYESDVEPATEAEFLAQREPVAKFAPIAETIEATPSPYVIHDGKVYVKESRTVEIDELVFSERTGRIYTVEYGFSFDPDTLSVGYVNGAYVQRNLYALNPVATEKRQARVGERIVIVAPFMTRETYDKGDVFTVTKVAGSAVEIDKGGRYVCGVILHDEYVVLADSAKKDAEPALLNVGDYAKVRNYSVDNYRVNDGDIVRVTRNDLESIFVYRAEPLSGSYYEVFSLDQLTLATDAEVKEAKESAEAARKAAEVSAKWEKIGRKVNEFMERDVVRVTDASLLCVGGKIANGDIVELGAKDVRDGTFRLLCPGVTDGGDGSVRTRNAG